MARSQPLPYILETDTASDSDGDTSGSDFTLLQEEVDSVQQEGATSFPISHEQEEMQSMFDSLMIGDFKMHTHINDSLEQVKADIQKGFYNLNDRIVTTMDQATHDIKQDIKQMKGLVNFYKTTPASKGKVLNSVQTQVALHSENHKSTQTDSQLTQTWTPKIKTPLKTNKFDKKRYSNYVCFINANFQMCHYGYEYFRQQEALTPPLYDTATCDYIEDPEIGCPRCFTINRLDVCVTCKSTHYIPLSPCGTCSILHPHQVCTKCNHVLLTNLEHFTVRAPTDRDTADPTAEDARRPVFPYDHPPPIPPASTSTSTSVEAGPPQCSSNTESAQSSDSDSSTLVEENSSECDSMPSLEEPDPIQPCGLCDPPPVLDNPSPSTSTPPDQIQQDPLASSQASLETTTPTSTGNLTNSMEHQRLNPHLVEEYRRQANYISECCQEMSTHSFWKEVCEMLNKTTYLREVENCYIKGYGWKTNTWEVYVLLGYIFHKTQGMKVFHRILCGMFTNKLLTFNAILDLAMDIRYLQHCQIPEGEKHFMFLDQPFCLGKSNKRAKPPHFNFTLAQIVATLVVKAIQISLYPTKNPYFSQSEVARMLPNVHYRVMKSQHLLTRAITLSKHQCECDYHRSFILPGPFRRILLPSKEAYRKEVRALFPTALSDSVLDRSYLATAGRSVFLGMHNLTDCCLPITNPLHMVYTDPIPVIPGLSTTNVNDSYLRTNLRLLNPTFTEEHWQQVEKHLYELQACAYDRFHYIFQHIDFDVDW